MSPITHLYYDGVSWVGSGGEVSPPTPPTDRSQLVPGAYIPDDTTTGPYNVTNFTQVNSAGVNAVVINTPTTYNNCEVWGQIQVKSGGAGTIFRNCIIRGANPDVGDASGSSIYGMVKSFTNNGHVIFEDCLFDPLPWVTQRGASELGQTSTAVHGADFELIRCEIRNVQDGVNLVGNTGSMHLQYTKIQQSWIHKGFFKNNTPNGNPDFDDRTHSDAIQFNYIKNIDIIGNMLGGPRDMVGYQTWPGGYNSGDDYWNSIFMIGQEGDDSIERRIENVLIDRNYLCGGTASLHLAYKSQYPNSRFASLTASNNKIFQRGSDWGITANKYGGMDVTGGGSGRYIIKHTPLQCTLTNNTIYETGAPAPISTG